MMQYILQHPHWDFMLGQTKHTYYHDGNWQWRYLGDLPVTLNQSFYLQNIFWTKTHVYGPINLFAFFKPRRNGATAKTIETRYVTTSLPIAHTLRRLGHRRWGIEPMFRDYKSSGWHIDQSALQDPDRRNKLLLLLAINYLWATIYGRWVCKSGLRKQFTAKKTTFQSFSAGSRLVDSSTQFRQIHSATFIFILLTALFLRNRRFYERKALFFLIVVYTGETRNLQPAP